MKKQINFIIPEGKENIYGYYEKILRTIVDPVRMHIPDSLITSKPLSNAINIHFFLEDEYLKKNDPTVGTSVFLSHGIADKHWRDGGYVQSFHYVCVSGPLWKNKMLIEGISDERILVVGYPKLDPIFQGIIKRSPSERKQILWAPTHSSATPSSYPDFLQYVDQIPSEYEFISSPHPFHNNGEPTLQKLVDADLIISDTSSLLYEAWAIGKPVLFPDWLVKPLIPICFPYSFEDYIYQEKIGYHADHMIDLLQQIPISIQNGLKEKEIEFMEGIFPTHLRGSSGKITAEKLLELT